MYPICPPWKLNTICPQGFVSTPWYEREHYVKKMKNDRDFFALVQPYLPKNFQLPVSNNECRRICQGGRICPDVCHPKTLTY